MGINLNHLTDGADRSPARSLADAVRELRVAWLRFPGGEKADAYMWSRPPFDTPKPYCCRTGPGQAGEVFGRFIDEDGAYSCDTLAFDEFVRLCRMLDAEPIIVVACDSYNKDVPDTGTKPTREELIDNARTWVRYANVTRGYGIRYWEIGNECYLDSYNGALTATQYALDVLEFSRAMRSEDPSIRIGANGPNGTDAVGALDKSTGTRWWECVLHRAAGSIDFISIHDYPCMEWMSFDAYAAVGRGLPEIVDQARACLREYCTREDAQRIKIAITETNSADWYGHPQNSGWRHENSIGHAIVLLDILGGHMIDPDLLCTILWNTRWIHNDSPGTPELWDALRSDNSFNPTGVVVSVLGRYAADQIGRVDTPSPLTAFIGVSGRRATLLVANRSVEPQTFRVHGVPPATYARYEEFSGQSPDDTAPSWTTRRTSELDGSIVAPGASLLVLPLGEAAALTPPKT